MVKKLLKIIIIKFLRLLFTPFSQEIYKTETSQSQSQGTDLGSDLDRGLRLLKQKRYHQAAPWLQQALVVDPDSATAHAALGWAYYNLGQFKSALAEAEIVIDLEPNHPDLPLLIRYLRQHR